MTALVAYDRWADEIADQLLGTRGGWPGPAIAVEVPRAVSS